MNKTSPVFKTLFLILVFGAAIFGCERRPVDQTGARSPSGSGSLSSGASESSSASGSYGAPAATQRTERGIADSVITTKAKMALLADTTVKGSEIHVETNKGVVALSGMVDNDRQLERATSIVKGIDGVRSVENKMTVKQ